MTGGLSQVMIVNRWCNMSLCVLLYSTPAWNSSVLINIIIDTFTLYTVIRGLTEDTNNCLTHDIINHETFSVTMFYFNI